MSEILDNVLSFVNEHRISWALATACENIAASNSTYSYIAKLGINKVEKLLEMDEVKLEFADDALEAIAKKAKEKKVGARALRSIIEEYMLDIMYEIPKDENIGAVTITKEYIEKKGGPQITMRGCVAIEDKN